MKKIIGLSIAALLLIGLAVGGTMAYFSDTETSSANQFTAGVIDLEIDCAGDTVFSAQDDPLPEIFNYLPSPGTDIKPGADGEVTLSLHLKDGSNNATLWMQIPSISVVTDGGINSEPECECEGGTWNNTTKVCDGATAVDDNIADHINVQLWIDDGDNELNGAEVYFLDGTLQDLLDLVDDKYIVQANAVACTIYYVGWSWQFPDAGNDTDNCFQGDLVSFDIVFGADQIAVFGP